MFVNDVVVDDHVVHHRIEAGFVVVLPLRSLEVIVEPFDRVRKRIEIRQRAADDQGS